MKLSRGRVSNYRLSYRTSSDSAVSQIELSGEKTQHLLENLQPDTIYLLRLVAATSVGWGEQSAWTSHRTPKASSARGTTFDFDLSLNSTQKKKPPENYIFVKTFWLCCVLDFVIVF